ncbi:hypothetical protein Rsub_12203 [Raphidocelis subcapitata]|uniref:CARDB domain-containing protein n=1 Tax=Raphidocelis subcapitata TaxID=307507 RepID=A0A2V0PIE8_9CHLO|nr:hypothetical protein Rsub_12203 [Raphidocelis subcapitata]|eukprot:GBF99578.1 hypothetical protein Rsub_12203 [Raphidocelis subcapitata]
MAPAGGRCLALLLALLALARAVAAGKPPRPDPPGASPQALRWKVFPPMPVYAQPGRKLGVEVYVWSRSNATTPATKLNFYANLTGGNACAVNQPPDATVEVPPLAPFQVRRLKAKVPAPSTEGRGVLRWCLEGAGARDDVNREGHDYEVTTAKAPALGIASTYPIAYYSTAMSPEHPVVGQSYTISFGIVNYGTAPSLPNTTLAVWGGSPWLAPACGEQASSPPDALLTLPKIAPGATHRVKGLDLPSGSGGYDWALVMVDWPSCNTPSPIVPRLNADFSYDAAASPMPSFAPQGGEPKTSAFRITTSPRSPKAGGRMTVKLRATNTGDADGRLGAVYVWLTKFNGAAGRYVEPVTGQRCAWSGYAAAADLTGVVVAPGKSTRVAIPDVPVPSEPGEYYVAVVFDGTCENPYFLADTTYSTRAF